MSNLRCDLTCDFTKFLGVCSSIFFLSCWVKKQVNYLLFGMCGLIFRVVKKIKMARIFNFLYERILNTHSSQSLDLWWRRKVPVKHFNILPYTTKKQSCFFPFFISCYFFIFIPNVCPSLCQNNPGHSLGMKII